MTNPNEDQKSEQGVNSPKVPESRSPKKVAKTFSIEFSKLTRRVAKTLLEQNVSQDDPGERLTPVAEPVQRAEPVQPAKPAQPAQSVQQPSQPVQPTQPAPAANKPIATPPKKTTVSKKKVRVARTLLEDDLSMDFLDERLMPSGETKPLPRPQLVAKTMLDREVLLAAVAKSAQRRAVLIKELVDSRAAEPVIEPIQGDKEATPCVWKWDETNTKGRVRHCGSCKKVIYNFDGLKLEEAQNLVFKHENLEKFQLYKRDDGKFMTSDCSIASKRRRNMVVVVAASILSVTFAVALFLTLPHFSSQSDGAFEVQHPKIVATSSSKIAGKNSVAPAATTDGTFHWKEGMKPPASTYKSEEESTSSAAEVDDEDISSAPPTAPDPDAPGQNWTY